MALRLPGRAKHAVNDQHPEMKKGKLSEAFLVQHSERQRGPPWALTCRARATAAPTHATPTVPAAAAATAAVNSGQRPWRSRSRDRSCGGSGGPEEAGRVRATPAPAHGAGEAGGAAEPGCRRGPGGAGVLLLLLLKLLLILPRETS